MSPVLRIIAAAWGLSGMGWAARCTTALRSPALVEYDNYIAAAEQAMPARFASGELAWVPGAAAKKAAAELASGKLVRANLSDAALNGRIAAADGTVIHWIGAVFIRRASLADVRAVLEDYAQYNRIYRPMVFECRAKRGGEGLVNAYDAILGLRNKFRFASLFPQYYAFRVKARVDYSDASLEEVRVHLRSAEIRESDSGVPGRDDLLPPYHDHGIMWALNAYWRARPRASGIYLEFESITLARSVQAFACKLGFVPVPKSIVAAVMESLPADSVGVILEGTRAECERRAWGSEE